jgi:hypothetical protein
MFPLVFLLKIKMLLVSCLLVGHQFSCHPIGKPSCCLNMVRDLIKLSFCLEDGMDKVKIWRVYGLFSFTLLKSFFFNVHL